MNTQEHLRLAGAAQVVLGYISLGFSVMLTVLSMRDVRVLIRQFDAPLGVILALIFVLLALPFLLSFFQIWFGRSLAANKRWATRVVGFIWCSVGLLSFPIGTIIHGYTLWVLIQIDRQEALRTEQDGEP